MVEAKPEYPIEEFKTQPEWRKWLEKNHATLGGVWIRMFKKASNIPTISHDQALEEALCFGWIDGQVKGYDEKSWLQKFTPRRKKSTWSKINRDHIARLTKEGKMMPAGLKEVEAAKAEGRWQNAYDSPSTSVIPDDFIKELAKHKKAEAFFQTLNKSNRFYIAFQLQTAMKPETRERRMKKIIETLKQEKKFY